VDGRSEDRTSAGTAPGARAREKGEAVTLGPASWLAALAAGRGTGRLKGPALRTLVSLGLVALVGIGLLSLGAILRRDGAGLSSSLAVSNSSSPQPSASVEGGVDPSGSGEATALAASDGDSRLGVPVSVAELEAMIERHLERILAKIQGAGKVTVAVCLQTGATYIYGYDESQTSQTTQERDANGGTRTVTETDSSRETVIVTQGSSSQPVIVRIDLPPLGGVVVVAGGARDSRVKALLSQAVQVLYGVPAHRVIVLAGG
jgi:stage III sporulation protein AG